jgi:hypothetical protein
MFRVRRCHVRQASEAYSVPKSSLHDRLMKLNKGKNAILAPDMGTFRRTFSDEQEEELVAYIKYLDSRLMPLTKKKKKKKKKKKTLAFEFAENFKISHHFNQQTRNECVIYGESFDEGWIQCNFCNKWAHETCADTEGNPFFS